MTAEIHHGRRSRRQAPPHESRDQKATSVDTMRFGSVRCGGHITWMGGMVDRWEVGQ
jgi:hypothetical protein